ncbi:S-protein homolog 29-like [Vicia villosa]|uniref:S-protein homolog 29-like n=1 Tax=Vicia villosa TaxID=3911 RepID=UPI00273BFEA1|nr:S-protein homolog 29-like [Vicia villosa]
MEYPNSTTFKISVLIIILLGVKATGFDLNPVLRVTVVIRNDIPPHPTPLDLTVHCKSKQDDLGFHTLKFGETFMFRFRPSPFPKIVQTLYFCSFTWPGNVYLHYLDVYNQGVDNCRNCTWRIHTNGGCTDYRGYEQCHNWKGVALMDANNTSIM